MSSSYPSTDNFSYTSSYSSFVPPPSARPAASPTASREDDKPAQSRPPPGAPDDPEVVYMYSFKGFKGGSSTTPGTPLKASGSSTSRPFSGYGQPPATPASRKRDLRQELSWSKIFDTCTFLKMRLGATDIKAFAVIGFVGDHVIMASTSAGLRLRVYNYDINGNSLPGWRQSPVSDVIAFNDVGSNGSYFLDQFHRKTEDEIKDMLSREHDKYKSKGGSAGKKRKR